jgi:hypothetical protein
MEPSKEECALDMGQKSNDAAVKDARIKLSREECALDMGQKSNDAAVKDAPIKLRREECAGGMVQMVTKNRYPVGNHIDSCCCIGTTPNNKVGCLGQTKE